MKEMNRAASAAKSYPERVIQFGEGNFLRAFVDWTIQRMNDKLDFNTGVVVVQPIESGMVDMLNAQECLYHVNLQGLKGGKAVDSVEMVDCITRALNPYTQYADYLALAERAEMRFVFSNTTEAGIVFDNQCKLTDTPPKSYPAKLTQLLHHRFKTFNGDKSKGLLIFPCELIFLNGKELKSCINQYIDLWALGSEFKEWFDSACGVYCTLVDRIVPGFPKDTIDELKERVGFNDNLFVKGEIFQLWVIEAPKSVQDEFPAAKAGCDVLFVESEEPYHERKVTLLNGPHTVLSPVGYLSGIDTVRECVEDELIGRYINKVMYDELLGTLNLPKDELVQFAGDVLDRFRNPYVKHFVTSIMLNSFPKFKTRDLPGLKVYLDRNGKLPQGIVLGLAAIVTYYKAGKRGEDIITPNDDKQILDLLTTLWASGDYVSVAKGVLGADFIWGEDLNNIAGLTDLLAHDLQLIGTQGMREAVKNIL